MIYDYCYRYASSDRDFYFNRVEIASSDPRVTKVILDVNKNMHRLEISVCFSGDYTEEEAQVCADASAKSTVVQLSWHTNSYFGNPNFLGGFRTFTKEDGTEEGTPWGSIPMGKALSWRFNVVDPEEQAKSIKLALEQGRKFGDEKYDAYRRALVSDDVVTRYMSLYLILMYHHDDYMPATDEYIKRTGKILNIEVDAQDRTFTISKPGSKPKSETRNETVFTRLRNELAHNLGVSTEKTCEKMDSHLGNLMKLTKRCIETQPEQGIDFSTLLERALQASWRQGQAYCEA